MAVTTMTRDHGVANRRSKQLPPRGPFGSPCRQEVIVLRIRSLHLLFLACATSCALQQPQPAELDDLAGIWQLVGDVPVGARIPTLGIQRDGHVGGSSGVNRYQTTLESVGEPEGSFRVGAPSTTRMMGPREAMQLEASFLDALRAADRAVIVGDELVLNRGEQPLLRFSRVTRG